MMTTSFHKIKLMLNVQRGALASFGYFDILLKVTYLAAYYE